MLTTTGRRSSRRLTATVSASVTVSYTSWLSRNTDISFRCEPLHRTTSRKRQDERRNLMHLNRTGLKISCVAAATVATVAVNAPLSPAQPPIVQPGAPGEPSRQISAAEASDLAGIKYAEADVKFMQGMISHHAQALEMTQLLDTLHSRYHVNPHGILHLLKTCQLLQKHLE